MSNILPVMCSWHANCVTQPSEAVFTAVAHSDEYCGVHQITLSRKPILISAKRSLVRKQ